MDFEMSSTTLATEVSAVLASESDPTRYQRVGLHPVHFAWSATLALDEAGTIIGGGWTGDPPDGPDLISFPPSLPWLTDAGMLEVNPKIQWSALAALARASAAQSDLDGDGGELTFGH